MGQDNSKDHEHWKLKGNNFLEQKNPKKALECYEKALKLKPDYADAHNNKAKALDSLSRAPEALESYNEAIRLKPDCAIFYHNKANTLNNLNRELEALELIDKALKLKPDFWLSYGVKCAVLINLNKYLEAIECANEAIKIKPDFAEPHFYKGNAFIMLNRWPDAIESLNEAIKFNPRHSMAYYFKALMCDKLERKLEAIECYDETIKYDPDFVNAHYNKGLALTDLGRHEEALRCYNKVIQLKHDHIGAWNNKGFSLRQLGRHMEAINLAIQMTMQGLGNPLLEGQRREEMAAFMRCSNEVAAAQANRLVNTMQSGTNRESIAYTSKVVNQDQTQLNQAFIDLQNKFTKWKGEFEKLKAAAETNPEYQEEINEKYEATEARHLKISGKVSEALNSESNESNEEIKEEMQTLIKDIEKFKKRTEKKISHLKTSMGLVDEQNESSEQRKPNVIIIDPEIEIGPSKIKKYSQALYNRLQSALKEAEVIFSNENYNSAMQNSNLSVFSQAIELIPIVGNVFKNTYSGVIGMPTINNMKKNSIKFINALGIDSSSRENVIKKVVETVALNNRDKISSIEDDPEIEYWINQGIAAKCKNFFTIKEANTYYQNKPEVLGCIDALKIIYAIESDQIPRDLTPDETIKHLASVLGTYKFSKAKGVNSNANKNACCTTF